MMNIEQLKARMTGFLRTDYHAYLFMKKDAVIGYAPVNFKADPLYLRQFLIGREFRRMHKGKEAFRLLMETPGAESIDIEVLSRYM